MDDDPEFPPRFSPTREARESGCAGLLRGYAVQSTSGALVHATSVHKGDGPFICPACLADVIVRHPWRMRHHFAHHPRHSPLDTSRESRLHFECKMEIFTALRRTCPQGGWICDSRRLKANAPRGRKARKPDIGGRINGKPVVIEIQKSALGIRELIARTRDYNERGISILWVVPLKEPLGKDIFQPRLIERYLHAIYFGRVYYWLHGMGGEVLPVHFGPATRMVPFRTNENGYWEEAGWDERPYKVIRKPREFETTIPILRAFKPRKRPAFLSWGEHRPIPPALLWMDVLKPWWPRKELPRFRRFYPSTEGDFGEED
ncbi:competence protein CoiA family protein [Verrucomicrobium spinosum]|uniref:competence protein CoiA family protein n=1 Tax=Verrucomicrobium spinosum TaxID=2736 RepID=UPI0009D65122|nr:competence protein CoiA family protein [Verrucomicrobium spinosum]